MPGLNLRAGIPVAVAWLGTISSRQLKGVFGVQRGGRPDANAKPFSDAS